jgi:hypothetical protein
MIILGTLAVGVIASLLFPEKEEAGEDSGLQPEKVESRREEP